MTCWRILIFTSVTFPTKGIWSGRFANSEGQLFALSVATLSLATMKAPRDSHAISEGDATDSLSSARIISSTSAAEDFSSIYHLLVRWAPTCSMSTSEGGF